MSGCAGNHYYVDNDDTAQAEWRFTVAAGSSYLVMTTWDVWDENVSDALFAVYDGVALEDELPVNLTASPGDVVEAVHIQEIIDAVDYLVDNGVWTSIGTCTPS